MSEPSEKDSSKDSSKDLPNSKPESAQAPANGVPPANIIPSDGEIPLENQPGGCTPEAEDPVEPEPEGEPVLHTSYDPKLRGSRGAEKQEWGLVEGLVLTGNDAAPIRYSDEGEELNGLDGLG